MCKLMIHQKKPKIQQKCQTVRCALMLLSELQLGRIMDDALQKHYILTGPIRRFCICQRLSIEPNRHPISELIEEYKSIQRLSKKSQNYPLCTYAVERAAARRNNGRRSPDARCFDRPHSSFLLCINYVVCMYGVCVCWWENEWEMQFSGRILFNLSNIIHQRPSVTWPIPRF